MIASAILLAALSGAPLIASGTYDYTATFNGKSVGSATIVVKDGAGTPTEIDEQSSGTMNGQSATAKDTLLLGGDLAPTAYSGDYDVAGTPSQVSVKLTPTTATVGDQSFGLSDGAKHFVVLEPGLLAGVIALPAQMQAWNDPSVMAVIPGFGIAAPIATDASLTGPRPANLPASDVAISFAGEQPFTIWYDPATLVPDELQVSGQALVVTRVR
ncbi:MAG TPA: hypothetical protein VMH02_07500 [Verrucomicrobiae bacterium]|nr:hypothetical protein [Verrucomicrobiae bacterium]